MQIATKSTRTSVPPEILRGFRVYRNRTASTKPVLKIVCMSRKMDPGIRPKSYPRIGAQQHKEKLQPNPRGFYYIKKQRFFLNIQHNPTTTQEQEAGTMRSNLFSKNTTRDSNHNIHGTWSIHPANTYLFYITNSFWRGPVGTASERTAYPTSPVLHFWARDLSYANSRNDRSVKVPGAMPSLFRRDKTKTTKCLPWFCRKYISVSITILPW